jgi:hypothetical protein
VLCCCRGGFRLCTAGPYGKGMWGSGRRPGGCMKGDQSFVENLEAHARQHVDANNFRFNGTDPSDMGCIYALRRFLPEGAREQGGCLSVVPL